MRAPPTPATPSAASHAGFRRGWDSSRATVAITGGPTQSNPRSTTFSILGASEHRGMHEGREYHERGRTSITGAR